MHCSRSTCAHWLQISHLICFVFLFSRTAAKFTHARSDLGESAFSSGPYHLARRQEDNLVSGGKSARYSSPRHEHKEHTAARNNLTSTFSPLLQVLRQRRIRSISPCTVVRLVFLFLSEVLCEKQFKVFAANIAGAVLARDAKSRHRRPLK